MISNEIMPKLCSNFYCENCDYTTSKKSSYNNHLMSSKHIKSINGNKNMPKFCSDFICQNCNKKYKDNSGLWRHKKKCNINEILEEPNNITPDVIMSVLEQNKELQQMLMEQNKTIIELSKNSQTNITNNTNNTNNNKSFNLNFFLNETCKDAMNIMDFVDSIQLKLSDLERVGDVGFVKGISKIFIKELNDLELTNRPVHCSDPKRETLYIKNNNEWNKEDENKGTLLKAIKHVAKKNMKQIPEWAKQHPEYNDSSSKANDTYLKIVSESMSGSTQEESEKNYNKIIKNIVKESMIDK